MDGSRRCTPGDGPRTRGRAGFTLVELLVVVAIVSLLLAILLPSLRAARSQAKRVACLSNLRQVGLAFPMYLADSAERWPARNDDQVNYGGQQGRAAPPFYLGPKPLNRYLNLPVLAGSFADAADVASAARLDDGAPVFACRGDEGGDYVQPTFYEGIGNSYSGNLFLLGERTIQLSASNPVYVELLLAALETRRRPKLIDVDAARLAVTGDAGWFDHVQYEQRPGSYTRPHETPCHANLQFMDGHAAFTRLRRGLHVWSDYGTVPIGNWAERIALAQLAPADPRCPDE